MSSFKSGTSPFQLDARPVVWPTFAPTVLAPAAMQADGPKRSPSPDEVLTQAHLKAAEILQQAAAQAEEALLAARKEGYEAGMASALEQSEVRTQQAQWELERAQVQAESMRKAAEADVRALRAEAAAERQVLLTRAREEAQALLESARAEQRQLLESAQSAVADLAVAAAMRLVQGHLAIQPGAVVTMVAAGLRKLRDSQCTVRVSPQDLPLLHAQRSTLERELGAGSLKLQADGTLQSGSFMIQSPNGMIDATAEQQSAALRTALTAALGGD